MIVLEDILQALGDEFVINRRAGRRLEKALLGPQVVGRSVARRLLRYRGPLQSTQARDRTVGPLADHKQEIRKIFHRQLRHLWADNKFLSETKLTPSAAAKLDQPISDLSQDWGLTNEAGRPLIDMISDRFHRNGYRFVPLVREEMAVTCSLDVMYLRRYNHGHLFYAGDIDNRMKTLIDALRMPTDPQEFGKYGAQEANEDPFFVLLQEDKLVTGFSVETDLLLDYEDRHDENALREVNLIISVSIKPYSVTLFNLNFA
jgi:hypothetical protein